MTPEADRILQKAVKHLERGQVMLGVGLYDDAGKAAYLAAFHARKLSYLSGLARSSRLIEAYKVNSCA